MVGTLKIICCLMNCCSNHRKSRFLFLKEFSKPSIRKTVKPPKRRHNVVIILIQ